MHGGGVERDEWLARLQLLLNVRLRTVSFDAASRNRPPALVPLPLPNSQYIIDGVMWSVRDNTAWAFDAWLTIQNHLQSCSQRHAQLADQISRAHAPNGPHFGAAERERLYTSHACVQDVYIAFCLVDSFLRHTRGELTAAARDAVEKELPRLVADHMPIWQTARSPCTHDAVEDYRLLFLDLLRSWTVTKLLRPDTHRRIEEYVRHKLKTVRSGLEEGEGNGNGNSAERRQPGAIRAGLRALLTGAEASEPSSSLSTVDVVRKNMREFMYAIFPPHRSESGRQRCAHCGAIFKSVAAKNAHYRYHFYNRSYLTEEKIVRLPYPTVQDYIASEVDCGATGNFIRITENLLDVLRVPEKQTVRVRKEK